MYKFLLLTLSVLFLAPDAVFGQDCGSPAPLCYTQFDNIQSDSTDVGPLLANFACGMAVNGSLYEITTVAPGAFQVQVQNVDCDSQNTTEGDSITVVIFTSSSSLNPCPPALITELECASFATAASFTQNALTAGQQFYVAVFGDMDADDLTPANCGYDIQIAGDAVEFVMTTPTDPIQILLGEVAVVEDVTGVDEYLWSGPGFIDSVHFANPVIQPGGEGTFLYNVMGTLGDCVVNQPVTIIVTPNIIPADMITPNGDDLNDGWYIANLDTRFDRAEIQVFDRWGQVVYNAIGYDVSNQWDGTRNGKLLPAGTYYYVIDLNIDGQDTNPFTGALSIIY